MNGLGIPSNVSTQRYPCRLGCADTCPLCCDGSLAQNFIDAVGASELGALLMHTSTLTQLDLSRAGMTNSCVFSLSKALAFNRCLCCKHYAPLVFALSLLARYSCHPTVLVVATRPLSPFANMPCFVSSCPGRSPS